MLPRSFTLFQLFTMIASLSYMGDFRMGVAENPNKVHNIVAANVSGFTSLYGPILRATPTLKIPDAIGAQHQSDMQLEQVTTQQARMELISSLPETLRFYIGDAATAASLPEHALRQLVARSVAEIVAPAAASQAIKGLFTAGVSTSITYSLSKLSKAMSDK